MDPEQPKEAPTGSQSTGDLKTLSTTRTKERMYETLSGLPFKVRAGENTAFDHSTNPGTVVLGVEQLARLGITEQNQIDFIVLHELGHFFELSQDPEGYMKVIDEAKRDDGLGTSYFRFYNALMDIYVNRNTRNNAPVYREGSDSYSEEIKEMYTEKLFPTRDLTELPLSTQYSYALLNIGMGVGEDLTLSPEVQSAIDEPLSFVGEELSTTDFIETYLIPAIGRRQINGWQATIGQRKKVIDATLRARFESLVEKDKQQERDPNQGDAKGDIEGFEASPEELEKAIKEAKEIQRKAQRTPEEKAADDREEAVKDLVKQELSPEEAKDFAKTHRRVYPQIVDVANILKSIVRQELDYRKQSKGYFTSGDSLDVNEAVERFHTIQTNPTEARVFKKQVYQAVSTEIPQHVRIWGAVDLSISMKDDIDMVRELCLIFGGAVQMISDGAQLGQHELQASLCMYGYNDDAFEIIPYTGSPTVRNVAKGYKHLVASGVTYEASALQKIADEITNRERGDNVVDIVVAVTDGDTHNPEESISLVDDLTMRLGAKALAFKFSSGYHGSQDNADRFGQIWRTQGYRIQGAANVVPAVQEGLRDLLKK